MLRATILATAAIALAGLAASAPARAADITLQFWDNQQTESGLSQYQKEAVKRFEAENPGIKVNVVTVPYPEYQQRLLTAVQGGNAPDVSTVDQIWNAAFAEAGAIEPLDDRAKAAGIKADEFFKGAWDSANYDGKLWGIPFNVDVWSFTYYNKKLFGEAGVDPASATTWEGLLAAGEEADRSRKRPLRRRPVRAQGRGHGRRDGQLHLLQRRQRAGRAGQVRADAAGSRCRR